ncbi:hypothetical protein [Piscinibacter koreensis]|uniref:Uncharacterized protein n=1 Tax=Piscinibacter koreensis TaxID=2742824 RepID=A0A7Y6NKV7_9BURK|nr:hypothetical protein [Schlegelella koreensis]NUZ04974.1 hypothetical protein [Schlegelella koreensis]
MPHPPADSSFATPLLAGDPAEPPLPPSGPRPEPAPVPVGDPPPTAPPPPVREPPADAPPAIA